MVFPENASPSRAAKATAIIEQNNDGVSKRVAGFVVEFVFLLL